MKFHVCRNNVGEAHQRKLWKNNVHLICGNPKGDDVYGQSVLCFTYSKNSFLNVFVCLLKLSNDRNENKYI